MSRNSLKCCISANSQLIIISIYFFLFGSFFLNLFSITSQYAPDPITMAGEMNCIFKLMKILHQLRQSIIRPASSNISKRINWRVTSVIQRKQQQEKKEETTRAAREQGIVCVVRFYYCVNFRNWNSACDSRRRNKKKKEKQLTKIKVTRIVDYSSRFQLDRAATFIYAAAIAKHDSIWWNDQ